MRTTREGLASAALLTVVSIVLLLGGCGDDNPGTPLVPCATPTFEPAPGIFERPVLITIRCETPGAEIRYTTNGSDPDEESLLYSNPFAISTTLTLKARAWKEGFTASEVATGSYAIHCAIALTAPLGGEVLPSGSSYTISWMSTVCAGPILIELLLNDAVCDTIASGASDTGGFDWVVEGCEGGEDGYRIRVTDIPSGATDQSDNPFSISTLCRITVTEPSEDATWRAEELHTIRWATSGSCGGLFRIDLLVDESACRTIAEAALGDSFDWEAAQCGAVSAGYRIRVTDLQSGASDLSEGSFSIPPLQPPACSIMVIDPAGGEEWLEETGYYIRWISSDCSDLVRIDLLRDGVACSTVAESTVDDGTFMWIAGRCDHEEDGYRIRVSDLRSSASGSSAGDFSIPGPLCVIDLLAPDGAEEWMQGTEQTIQWTTFECGDSVSIDLLDGATPCREIAASTPNDGSFPWTVERCASEDGYRIQVTDLRSGSFGRSARTFLIPLPPCDLELVSPNGGESWQEGTDHEITWNAVSCVTDVRIELHRDGLLCRTIEEHAPNTGRFAWNPVRCGAEETGYAIRIVDLAGDDTDASDATFSIPAPPPCRPMVTSPAAGTVWLEGTPHDILWEPSTCDELVRIELQRSGDPCLTIAASTPNDGSFDWTARQCATTEDGYKIRVTGIESEEAGESEQTFSIVRSARSPSATPQGARRSPRHPRARSSGREEVRAAARYGSSCSETTPFARRSRRRTSNDGAFEWVPAPCDEEEDGYRIRVTDPATGVERLVVRAVPHRQVRATASTSPNGGESWVEGTAQEIRWSSSNCGGTVDIELLRNGTPCKTIASTTSNDGVYVWSSVDLWGCSREENGYTIRVTDTRTGRSDDSDAPFTIPIRRLTILSPAGGEDYETGSEQTITWTSENCDGNVSIYPLLRERYAESRSPRARRTTVPSTWTPSLPCDESCGYSILVLRPLGGLRWILPGLLHLFRFVPARRHLAERRRDLAGEHDARDHLGHGRLHRSGQDRTASHRRALQADHGEHARRRQLLVDRRQLRPPRRLLDSRHRLLRRLGHE